MQINKPSTLIYVQKINPESHSGIANIKSIMKIRHNFSATDLVPLPFFFIEKKTFLDKASWHSWESLVCPHGRLLLNYFDIYPSKKYSNLLYKEEHRNIQSSRILRFERELIKPNAVFYNKLLLGITMLPKAIAEALLESDPAKLEIFRIFLQLWSSEKCTDCVQYYRKIGSHRIIERYLFLRYQTQSSGNLF